LQGVGSESGILRLVLNQSALYFENQKTEMVTLGFQHCFPWIVVLYFSSMYPRNKGNKNNLCEMQGVFRLKGARVHRFFKNMPPKRDGKRKTPDTLSPDRATEPVVDDSATNAGASSASTTQHRATAGATSDQQANIVANVESLYRAAIETAPEKDVAFVTEIKLLGHYPRSLNFDSRSSATQERQEEASLYKRLGKRRKTLGLECLAFLDALKQQESSSRASEPVLTAPRVASSTSAAPQPASTGFDFDPFDDLSDHADRTSLDRQRSSSRAPAHAPSLVGAASSGVEALQRPSSTADNWA
jgi:hypothetical protein